MKVLSAFPHQVLFKGLNQPSETAEGHSSPLPLSTPRVWGFFPKVYIDEPTSFPVRLQKRHALCFGSDTETLCHFRSAQDLLQWENTVSWNREFSDHGADSKKRETPVLRLTARRDFNSVPNSLRHLKKLYTVYGCRRKKSPHLSNWSSAAQSKQTSTTNNCVNKYKHKNTVLWHVICA